MLRDILKESGVILLIGVGVWLLSLVLPEWVIIVGLTGLALLAWFLTRNILNEGD